MTTNTYSPYIGLRPYQEEHKDNFYGRDRDSRILSDKLLTNRLTLLFAASGVGKTSLLNAAVIPYLKSPTGKSLPVIYHNDWVTSPLKSLSKSIHQSLQQTQSRFDDGNAQNLAEQLRYYTLPSRHPVILILDQFEEFFRYQRNHKDFKPFIKQLTQIILDHSLPVNICFSMREDFALELNAFKPELPTILFENFYRLEKLNEAATREAVLKPLKKAGFDFEDGLLDELLNDLLSRELDRNPKQLASDAEQKTAEPPYLQIICTQLWLLDQHDPDKLIRKATYNKAGKAKGLRDNYINKQLAQFSDKEKRVASHAFDHLISHRGTKMAYTAGVLAHTIGGNKKELQKVLDKLEVKRILRSQKRDDDTWYELYHDMFSPSLEDWNTRWKNKMRRRKTVISVLSIGLIGFSITAGYIAFENATSYHIRSKNTPEARLELWQGKTGLPDWFHQQHFIKQTRYQRQDIEPDKCVNACNIDNYDDFDRELIANLSLLKRIDAYAKAGVLGNFDVKDVRYSKTAFGLAQKTLENKNTAKSIETVKVVMQIPVNRAWRQLVGKELFNETNPKSFRRSIVNNQPWLATKTLMNGNIDKWLNFSLTRDYLDPDWIDNFGYANENYFFDISTYGKSNIKSLIQILKGGDTLVRSFSADALGELQAKQAVPNLMQALKDEDTGVRKSATEALGKLQAKQAVPNLMQALKDKSEAVRSSAAIALGGLQAKQVIPNLMQALKDEGAGVRKSAAEALGKLQAKQAIPNLIQALKDEDKYVRLSATKALEKLQAKQAIPNLIQVLTDKDEYVRKSAAEALGKLQAKQAIPNLIQALKDEDTDVRLSAAIALGILQAKQAIPNLIEALRDKNENIQEPAAFALGMLQAKRAIPSLIQALKYEDAYVKSSATEALGMLQAKQVIPNLIQALKDGSIEVQESATLTLGILQAKQAIPNLIRELKDIDGETQLPATKSLLRFNSTKTLEILIGYIFDEPEDMEKLSLASMESIAKKHQLHFMDNWLKGVKALKAKNSEFNDNDILGDYNIEENPDPLTKKTPPQLVELIKAPKTNSIEHINALNVLMQTEQAIFAKPILLQWLNDKTMLNNYGHIIYQNLADLKATESLDSLQQGLESFTEEWQDWREKRDALANDASDEESEAIKQSRPDITAYTDANKPSVTAYTYANSIARLDAEAGIKLLQHELYEARRGAWEGLADNADIALVKKLHQLNQNSKDPLEKYALYQALDQSLKSIDYYSSNPDSVDKSNAPWLSPAYEGEAQSQSTNNYGKVTPQIIQTYQQDCKALNDWLNNGKLNKDAATYQRVEWTRDRIDETLESIIRVKWHMDNWFKTDFPKKGEEGYSYSYQSCYKP